MLPRGQIGGWNRTSAPVGFVGIPLLLVVASCTQPPPPQNSEGHKAPSPAAERVLPTPQRADLACVRAWLDDLAATADADRPAYADAEMRQYEADLDAGLIQPTESSPTFTMNVRSFSCGGTALFIDAGPAALPLLMPHLHDHRRSLYCYNYPTSSRFDTEYMTVSQVAGFMFEVIVRQEPYFTKTSRLNCADAHTNLATASDMHCFESMASAYEAWYERCFDQERSEIACSADDLPAANWYYDESAWPTLKRLDPERTARDFPSLAD